MLVVQKYSSPASVPEQRGKCDGRKAVHLKKKVRGFSGHKPKSRNQNISSLDTMGWGGVATDIKKGIGGKSEVVNKNRK